MIQFILRMIDKYRRYISYTIVGLCTTVVSYASYFILYRYAEIDPNIANIISIIIAVLFAYVTNKYFVFRSRCDTYQLLWFEFVKFISSRLITMLIEVVGVFVLLEWRLLSEMWAKVLVSIFIVILNYVLSHFFVFNQDEA